MAYHAAISVHQPQARQAPPPGYILPNRGEHDPGRVFVGGLKQSTSERSMYAYFTNFGDVTSVYLARNRMTQVTRCFGFVSFSDPRNAETVVNIPVHLLDGKRITVRYAVAHDPSNNDRRVFFGTTRERTPLFLVREYFERFGAVENAVMCFNPRTRTHRGFGFLTFQRKEIASLVCDIRYHEIDNRTVECKKAFPKYR